MPNSKGFEMGIAQECQNLALEQKLNKLIQKGWEPRNIETLYIEVKLKYGELHLILPQMGNLWKPIRLLVSKESGLWQFCMSKGFTPNVSCYRWEKWLYDIDDLNQCEADVSGLDNYGYRIIESALKDESELEKFLLDNIKV